MSLDPNSATGQLSGLYSTLAEYLQACNSHLVSAGSPASLSSLLGLNMDEALSLCLLTTDKGSSERVGALVDAVSLFNSVLRETSMATQTRIQIYAAAASEAQADSDLYSNIKMAEASLFGVKYGS